MYLKMFYLKKLIVVIIIAFIVYKTLLVIDTFGLESSHQYRMARSIERLRPKHNRGVALFYNPHANTAI